MVNRDFPLPPLLPNERRRSIRFMFEKNEFSLDDKKDKIEFRFYFVVILAPGLDLDSPWPLHPSCTKLSSAPRAWSQLMSCPFPRPYHYPSINELGGKSCCEMEGSSMPVPFFNATHLRCGTIDTETQETISPALSWCVVYGWWWWWWSVSARVHVKQQLDLQKKVVYILTSVHATHHHFCPYPSFTSSPTFVTHI